LFSLETKRIPLHYAGYNYDRVKKRSSIEMCAGVVYFDCSCPKATNLHPLSP